MVHTAASLAAAVGLLAGASQGKAMVQMGSVRMARGVAERVGKAGFAVVATSNNVEQMPPEMLRKGRFDDLFFIDLPTAEERAVIWNVHIAKRGREPAAFDIGALVNESAGMSGAEIEAAFIDAMFRAFSADTEVSTIHVSSALADTVPLSKTAADKIEALRAWATGRARNASAQQTKQDDAGRFSGLEIN